MPACAINYLRLPCQRLTIFSPFLVMLHFTGFSVCHPILNEQTMNLSLRHAIYSAILSTEATVLHYNA